MITLTISLIFLFLTVLFSRRAYTGFLSRGSTLRINTSNQGAFRVFSASTNLTAIDHTLVFNGTEASTATLPDATICTGRVYSITNSSYAIPTPTLTVAPKAFQTIDGEPVCLLPLADQSIVIISDGVKWKVLTKYIPSASHSYKEASDPSVSYVNESAKRLNSSPVFYDVSGN